MKELEKNLSDTKRELNKYKVLYRVLKLENDNLKYNYRVSVDQYQILLKRYNWTLSSIIYRIVRKLYRGVRKIFGRK